MKKKNLTEVKIDEFVIDEGKSVFWDIKIDFDAILLLAVHVYLPRMILRPAPIFEPACVAPLFVPAWSPMTALPAAIVSSSKSRLFSSEGFGPSHGPDHSGCLYVCLE